MDGYEIKRREFLKKLGLIGGGAAILATGANEVAEFLTDGRYKIKLTEPQQAFMDKYEHWLEEFRDMAKFQKKDPNHLENNKKLMALADQATKWQTELHEYMEDENFARYYMIVTERVTAVI